LLIHPTQEWLQGQIASGNANVNVNANDAAKTDASGNIVAFNS
jgi:hypothetical protein